VNKEITALLIVVAIENSELYLHKTGIIRCETRARKKNKHTPGAERTTYLLRRTQEAPHTRQQRTTYIVI